MPATRGHSIGWSFHKQPVRFNPIQAAAGTGQAADALAGTARELRLASLLKLRAVTFRRWLAINERWLPQLHSC